MKSFYLVFCFCRHPERPLFRGSMKTRTKRSTQQKRMEYNRSQERLKRGVQPTWFVANRRKQVCK